MSLTKKSDGNPLDSYQKAIEGRLDFFEQLVNLAVSNKAPLDLLISICHDEAMKHKNMLINEDKTVNTRSIVNHQSKLDELVSKKESPDQLLSPNRAKRKIDDFDPENIPFLDDLREIRPPSRANDEFDQNKEFLGVKIEYSGKGKRKEIIGYIASIEIFGQAIELGKYACALEAAKMHDRALIRALGPSECSTDILNFPIENYSNDSLEDFSSFDSILNKKMFSKHEWTGPKECDFSFLILKNHNSPSIIKENKPTKTTNGKKKKSPNSKHEFY